MRLLLRVHFDQQKQIVIGEQAVNSTLEAAIGDVVAADLEAARLEQAVTAHHVLADKTRGPA